MKRMKKIFILFTMLIAGLSFKGANNADKNVVADAAENRTYEIGSYAFFDDQSWTTDIQDSWYKEEDGTTINIRDQGFSHSTIKTLLITNNGARVPKEGYLKGCPAEAGAPYNNTDYSKWAPTNLTDGCAVAAYVYPNAADTTKFDCILYANVETIYAISGQHLFSSMKNVEKITFDCNFSFAHSTGSMQQLFYLCENLVEIEGLNRIDTTNVTNMKSVFWGCKKLKEIDVSSFDTSKVTNLGGVFACCDTLTTIKGLENWNTAQANDMSLLFGLCPNLKEVNVSSFDTSNVTISTGMFMECSSLTSLDISNFDFSSITDENNGPSLLISGANNLTEIKAPKNLNGYTIELPKNFLNNTDMTMIDEFMQGMTILLGSKAFNLLFNTLMNLQTCVDYMQGPELQAMYDGLNEADKESFAALTDNDGVLLTDKLAYMVYLADYHSNTDTAATHMAISPRTSQYLVIVIACLSLAMLGGYYFIQKKKYAK